MSTRLLILLSLAACSGGGDSDDGFDECSGNDAQCAKLSVRWSIDRAGKDATCSVVGGTKIVATAKFQADGRIASFEAACDAGALLTSSLPIGPYEIDVSLKDAVANVLGSKKALATLGVSNTVTETLVALDIIPKIVPGGLFGACSASQPCSDPSYQCVQVQGAASGYCSPVCSAQKQCSDLYEPFAHELKEWSAVCGPTSTQSSQTYCLGLCSGDATGAQCPPGLTCRDAQPFGPTCLP